MDLNELLFKKGARRYRQYLSRRAAFEEIEDPEEMRARLSKLKDGKACLGHPEGRPVLFDDCTTFESLKKRMLDFDKSLDPAHCATVRWPSKSASMLAAKKGGAKAMMKALRERIGTGKDAPSEWLQLRHPSHKDQARRHHPY